MPKPKSKSATSQSTAASDRPVVYEDIQVQVCRGEDALTAEMWRNILGWEEEPEGADWKDAYLLKDASGRKVRCTNNAGNRPLTESWAYALAQEYLTRKFAPKGPNGEAVVIGRTGRVLSGQHRGIGLVLARQLWEGDQAEHWKTIWPTEPTMETIVVFGVDESDETVQTLDNVRPRSLSDVLYVGGYFGKLKAADRKNVCKILENAVKMLWSRTLCDQDAFAPRRTHAEALDFVRRHPKVVESVKHVYEENGGTGQDGRKIAKYLPLGYASALHYLMGVSGTPEEKAAKYKKNPSEKALDKSLWDKADEFWMMVASVDPALKNLRGVFDTDAGLQERMGWIIKAWGLWSSGGAVTPKNLQLAYETDEEGVKHLKEFPTLRGIDFGEKPEDHGDEDQGKPDETDPPEEPKGKKPTPEQVEEVKKKHKEAIKATVKKNREKANGKAEPAAEEAPAGEPQPEPTPDEQSAA